MIEIKNLNVSYAKQEVIKDLSLNVDKGKLISLVGANGSGKSTLIKSVIRIVPVLSGEIFVDEKSFLNLSGKELAKKVAYLAQGKSVPDMTVEQMVLHGRFPHLSYPRRYSENDRRIALSALEKTGLSEYRDKNLSSLSGGMRQNAYIAMSLAQDTDYILLDEPTSYLDITHQLRLMQTLRNLADSGKGIVTVMHDLPLAFNFSDTVAVLQNGKIAVCDTPENVCKSGIIKEIFGIELNFNPIENSYSYKFSEI